MSFRFRRLSFVAIIVAVAFAYGYFSRPGHQSTATDTAGPSISVKGASSIRGPYFSDRNRVADRIVAAINRTKHTLDIAVYSVTQPDLAATIVAAHRRGVRIRIVSDEGQALDRHSEIDYLRSQGIRVRLSGGFRGQRSLMHNKFAVFDKEVVETGSLNWTTSANSYNFENVVFIKNPEISKRYESEFDHIWVQAQ